MSSGPSIPPLRPDTGPLNIPGSGCPLPPTPIKEEEDTKDGADDSGSDMDNQAGAEMEGKGTDAFDYLFGYKTGICLLCIT